MIILISMKPVGSSWFRLINITAVDNYTYLFVSFCYYRKIQFHFIQCLFCEFEKLNNDCTDYFKSNASLDLFQIRIYILFFVELFYLNLLFVCQSSNKHYLFAKVSTHL